MGIDMDAYPFDYRIIHIGFQALRIAKNTNHHGVRFKLKTPCYQYMKVHDK